MKILFLILSLFIIPFIICVCLISGDASRREEEMERILNEKKNNK